MSSHISPVVRLRSSPSRRPELALLIGGQDGSIEVTAIRDDGSATMLVLSEEDVERRLDYYGLQGYALAVIEWGASPVPVELIADRYKRDIVFQRRCLEALAARKLRQEGSLGPGWLALQERIRVRVAA